MRNAESEWLTRRSSERPAEAGVPAMLSIVGWQTGTEQDIDDIDDW